jgi:hypothetical protein
MPEKATKNWGQADKDLLNDLINRQQIDITDTSLDNIERVRAAHFRHRDKRNFRRNFRDFAAAWDLEIEYSGARRRESGGKMRRFIINIFIYPRVL